MSGENGSELTPLKSSQISQFVMMNADMETINNAPLTNMTRLGKSDTLSAFGSASGSFKRATLALGQFMDVNDRTYQDLMLMANGLELMTGVGEAYNALRALMNLKALANIGRGVSALVGEGLTVVGLPYAIMAATAAVGGAIAFNEVIKDSMRQADVTVDYEGVDPVGMIRAALAAKGIHI